MLLKVFYFIPNCLILLCIIWCSNPHSPSTLSLHARCQHVLFHGNYVVLKFLSHYDCYFIFLSHADCCNFYIYIYLGNLPMVIVICFQNLWSNTILCPHWQRFCISSYFCGIWLVCTYFPLCWIFSLLEIVQCNFFEHHWHWSSQNSTWLQSICQHNALFYHAYFMALSLIIKWFLPLMIVSSAMLAWVLSLELALMMQHYFPFQTQHWASASCCH